MANIQAALNSILSSAQGAAFLASQTPQFQRAAEVQELKREAKEFKTIGEEISRSYEEGTDAEAEAAAELDVDLTKNEYKVYKKLLQKTGDPEYYKQALARVPSKQDEALQEFKEAKMLNKLEKKIESKRNQSNELTIRIDKLSSKEKGQFMSMYNKQQKKMKGAND